MKLRFSLLLGALLLAGFTDGPLPSKPLNSVEAAKQGKGLAAEIMAQQPLQNLTNAGVLRIRAAQQRWTEIPVKFETFVTGTNWQSVYEASWSNRVQTLLVNHSVDQSNAYFFHTNFTGGLLLGFIPVGQIQRARPLANAELNAPFAGSDFWIADLGLEFFHWPEQRLLRSELRKTRLCRVLESINPDPGSNGYSRILSWIDDESRGILHAEAYDFQNKLLKEFDTKKFRKVNDEWQLEEMEIANVQTRSRSQIEFNFDAR
jgi:hypothetical protein